jgi:N-methylhydantoinase A/oxoprolinase/acetone carboxylase beta subunit
LILRRLVSQRDSHCSENRANDVLASIKMGTTVATNALLERSAESCALVVSKGHADLLRIGDHTRPKLFDLNIRRPPPLFSEVPEIDERVTRRNIQKIQTQSHLRN